MVKTSDMHLIWIFLPAFVLQLRNFFFVSIHKLMVVGSVIRFSPWQNVLTGEKCRCGVHRAAPPGKLPGSCYNLLNIEVNMTILPKYDNFTKNKAAI